MREVNRHAILAYPANAMFDLVADVESYPAFLPGCRDAKILEDRGSEVIARLKLSQGPLKLNFTTRNTLTRPRSISLELVEGPFTSLNGQWSFEPLGEEGTRLALTLKFAFSSRVKDMAMGLVFEQTCNMLVDAFVKRAHTIYAGAVDDN